MQSASDPVILDAHYFDGDVATLKRRPSPEEKLLCNEYLVDLVPQRIRPQPSISIADYRKEFREAVRAALSRQDDYRDSDQHLGNLQNDLAPDGQIGQLLGFANPYDEQQDLYRQVALGRMGKRDLIYSDYWDSMEDYEACIEQWKDNLQLVKMYRSKRDNVIWLTSNKMVIAHAASQWQLLFKLDSNSPMNLNINDADPLYVFIQEEDLANKHFNNIAGEITQG